MVVTLYSDIKMSEPELKTVGTESQGPVPHLRGYVRPSQRARECSPCLVPRRNHRSSLKSLVTQGTRSKVEIGTTMEILQTILVPPGLCRGMRSTD